MHNDERRDDRYARLDELDDFKVASGDPDPRGWRVETRDGVEVGRVEDLVVDRDAMRARYLDVRVDADRLGLPERDRHVYIPVESVAIGNRERQEQRVTVGTSDQFLSKATARESVPRTTESSDWPAAERGVGCEVRFTRGGRSNG